MRKQLITAAAGGKKEGRNKEDGRGERGRSIGIAPNADGCGVFTFRGRQQTEREGKIYTHRVGKQKRQDSGGFKSEASNGPIRMLSHSKCRACQYTYVLPSTGAVLEPI